MDARKNSYHLQTVRRHVWYKWMRIEVRSFTMWTEFHNVCRCAGANLLLFQESHSPNIPSSFGLFQAFQPCVLKSGRVSVTWMTLTLDTPILPENTLFLCIGTCWAMVHENFTQSHVTLARKCTPTFSVQPQKDQRTGLGMRLHVSTCMHTQSLSATLAPPWAWEK